VILIGRPIEARRAIDQRGRNPGGPGLAFETRDFVLIRRGRLTLRSKELLLR
jgi:hypothetical protein